MTTYLHKILAIVTLIFGTAPAFSQSCTARFQIMYADGQQGCLSDFALIDEAVPGSTQPLRRAIPPSGLFNLSMTPRDGQCPIAVGAVMPPGNVSNSGNVNPNNTPQARSERASAACQKMLTSTSSTEQSCACRLIVEDGRSPLTRDQFVRHIGSLAGAPK
jgi:hypothetical protein